MLKKIYCYSQKIEHYFLFWSLKAESIHTFVGSPHVVTMDLSEGFFCFCFFRKQLHAAAAAAGNKADECWDWTKE